jgi:hypothetical protein
MSYIISAISIVTFFLYGQQLVAGPILGFLGQFLWLYYVSKTKQKGLLPCVLFFFVIHAYNWWLWSR